MFLSIGHMVEGVSYFDIDLDTGAIYTNVTLDREDIPDFAVKIKVGISSVQLCISSNAMWKLDSVH